jgi:hypothetical protein
MRQRLSLDAGEPNTEKLFVKINSSVIYLAHFMPLVRFLYLLLIQNYGRNGLGTLG